MAGVTADSVIVAIEARTKAYEAAMEAAARKTEAVFDRIRAQANKPVTLTANVKTSQTETREVEKNAQRKATAEEKASSKAAAAAEKAATRKAAADEKAAQRSIDAANKAAAREIAAQERISAAVERGLARRANAAAAGSGLGGATGSRALSARQTAAMRGGTALGGGGSMPAPTPAADKVNYFLRDQIDTQGRFNAAQAAGNRAEANALRDQLTQFRLINQYKRAGLSETEATARAEERVADIARRRANRVQAAPVADAAPPVRGGGGLAGAARTVRNLATVGFAGYGAVQGAREYLELTDAYKKYNAQLSLATMENGNLGKAQIDVQRIANETRSGLGETAQLYATFQRNAAQLGLTQTESARATEIITKSFKISGATATEAAGGLRQFLQGLQSGTLRGEEFNSVIENAPRLAKIFADQLTGGNIGALRELASEGKITGVEIKKALGDPAVYESINKEFAKLPVTFEDAMTVVKNAATITFGAFDEGGEFSKALTNFLTGGAAGFGDLATAASASGVEIRAAFEGLGDAFAPLLAGAQSAFGGIRSEANYTRDTIANILSGIDQIRNIPANLQNQANAFDRRVFGGQFRPDAAIANSSGTFLNSFNQSREYGTARVRDAQLKAQFGARIGKDGKLNLNPFAEAAPRAPVAVNKDLAKFTALNADLEKLKATASGKELATINKKIAKNNEIIQNLNQGVSLAAARGAVTGGGRGRTGKSDAEKAEDKRKAQADRFDQQNANLNDALLSAKGRQVRTIEDTLASDIAQADSENAKRKERFDQFTAAQQAELNAKSDSIAAQKKITAVYDAIVATANQNAELAINEKSAAVDAKQAEVDMTIGRAARAKLEDELLDLKYEERRLQIEKNKALALQNGDVAGADRADRDLVQAGTDRAVSRFRNREDAKGPYERYRENLTNADSLSDEIDGIKIEVLDQVADSLANATTKALGLTGALGDIVGQIIKIGIQRKLIGPIADGLFGPASGGGSGGAFGGFLGKLIGAASGSARAAPNGASFFNASSGPLLAGYRASGGDVSAGKIYRVNENGGEYFQPAMSGKIIPTGRAASAGGGGATTVIAAQQFDLRGVVMTEGLIRQMDARNRQYADTVAARSGRAAYNNSPARSQKLSQLGS